MDISHNAFFGRNQRDIILSRNGQSFRTKAQKDNSYAYAVVTPAVRGSFVRIGVRCSFSNDSTVLVGFLVGTTSLVLLDLIRSEFVLYGTRSPIHPMSYRLDTPCDCFVEWNKSQLVATVNGSMLTKSCPIPSNEPISMILCGSSFDCNKIICFEVDPLSEFICNIPLIRNNTSLFTFQRYSPVIIKALPSQFRRGLTSLRYTESSCFSKFEVLTPRFFNYARDDRAVSIATYLSFKTLQISFPSTSEFKHCSEMYLCGYGLRRSFEGEWITINFDLFHLDRISVGCVDGDGKPLFSDLKEHFHGKVLSSNEGTVTLKLASVNKRLAFSVSSESSVLYEISLQSDCAYFAWFYEGDLSGTDMTMYSLTCSSLAALSKWSDVISTPAPLSFLPTFLNAVLQNDDVFEATQTPRILTTDRGYTFGTASITLEIGENGIGGLGICCRPLNEYDPEHDSNSCYYDNIEGKMVGGCENNSFTSIFLNPGDIVQFDIDFELAAFTITVDSNSIHTHITHSLQNRPHPLYPCILFTHPGQSFRLLRCELRSGRDFGAVLGGDLKLQRALSRLSSLYWAQKDKYDSLFNKNIQSIPANAMESNPTLALLGNGAVCSAYTIHWEKSAKEDLIVKRIHPYLHSHTESHPFDEMVMNIDWRKECETDDYVKSFFFDFLISHNLRHTSFVQQYVVQEGPLKLTSEESAADEKTYYLFAERLQQSLERYLEQIDSPNGVGYLNGLIVLLKLALVLQHCFSYQIVHNDLKPDNIMLRSQDLSELCLIDFGESFIGFDVVSDSPSVLKGNQHFKAPEFLRPYYDRTVIDASRADVWSLGILAYTLIGKEANVPRIMQGDLGLDDCCNGPYAEKYKKFIEEVLVVDEMKRPDAFECVRILCNLLFDTPKSGIARTSELLQTIRKQDFENIPSAFVELLYQSMECCVCFIKQFSL